MGDAGKILLYLDLAGRDDDLHQLELTLGKGGDLGRHCRLLLMIV